MELKGMIAVITGSTGRLGRHISLALAEAGVDCVCHYYKNQQTAEELAERIIGMGRKALAVGADLTVEAQVESLFEDAGELGQVRILINSAALFSRRSIEDVDCEYIQQILNLNLIAVMLTSRQFAESIKKNWSDSTEPLAKIINLADVGGIRPWGEYSVYCSSKAGLIGLTKSLAKELAPDITVNAVAPGVIDLPEDVSQEELKKQLSMIPVGRLARAKDVTSAVLFLLRNDYINGQVLNVDGGRCI